jgi:ribulose kinase
MEWQQWTIIALIVLKVFGNSFTVINHSEDKVRAVGGMIGVYLYYIIFTLILYSGGFFTE